VPHHDLRPAQQPAHIAANLRWGISRALILTALTLLPATVVFLVSGAALRRADRHEFAGIAAAYAVLAVAGGVVVGLGRRMAEQSRVGAALVGAWVGAQSLLLGAFLAGSVRAQEKGLMGAFALIGALIGATLGLTIRMRARVWAARTRH
jgi:hypothetical protein